MTEAEWLTAIDPRLMLAFLDPHRIGRIAHCTMVLFVCASWRRMQAHFPQALNHAVYARELRAIEMAERYGCGQISESDFVDTGNAYHDWREVIGVYEELWTTSDLETCVNDYDLCDDPIATAFPEQAALLRCIVRNPFRPITLATTHRTPTVASLARAAYDERQLPSGELDLQRLAVLSDALEEAGATGGLLDHLRSPGPHVRGCWVVDLCLGKE